MGDQQSFQQEHFPEGECFGCGPANQQGLRINSFTADDGSMVCDWNRARNWMPISL